MKSNFLFQRILLIQSEYKNLLSNLNAYFNGNISYEALDEINLFWLRNMEVVKLYLTNEFARKDSYVFTASTFLDFEDSEQYPFLLIGMQHVLDDPLCKYSNICSKMPEEKIAEKLFEQIVKTVKDNLKVLENCNNEIIILPLRLLSQTPENSLLFQMGEKAFSSLFNNINNLKDFFEKCNSFDDVLRYARKDIENIVKFSESDDKTLTFEQRFNQAKEENLYMLEAEISDAHYFFIMVFGNIQQAVDVIVSCVEYECFPFIRYSVVLNYILLLEEVFSDITFISEMRYKMCVANLLYQICEKDRLSKFGFKRFTDIIKVLGFNQMLFKTLAKENIDEKTFVVNEAVPVIEKCLEQLYTALEIN